MLTISATVRTYPTSLPFEEMATTILGADYDLSLVFIGPTRARTLNETYRHHSYQPNVLSFPLSPTTGEIFICPHVAQREAARFNLSQTGYIAFLFIHGCLHLKGYEHGDTMERQERRYLRQFAIT